MSRLISHDPFARTEIHSSRVYISSGQTCSWCGQVNKTPKGRAFLNSYGIEYDSGRKNTHPKLFCSISCFRDYA